MTSFFRNSATCWRRRKSTDEYEEESEWHSYRSDNIDPDSYLSKVTSKFKHEVFAFALGKSPYEDNDTKSIYMYVGGFRYFKVYFQQKNLLRVEVRNDEVADVFRNASEQLAPGRWPRLKKDFAKQFKLLKFEPTGYYHWGYFLFQKKMVKVVEDLNQVTSPKDIDKMVNAQGYV